MLTKDSELKEVLTRSKNIAMIGCSPDRFRTSNYIASFLKKHGYRVIPVNPKADEIHGEKAYDSLGDIPENIPIHIVNIFRNKKHTHSEVEKVLREYRGEDRPAVWTQLGVSSKEAEMLAEQEGIPYIKDRCIMVEYERLLMTRQ